MTVSKEEIDMMRRLRGIVETSIDSETATAVMTESKAATHQKSFTPTGNPATDDMKRIMMAFNAGVATPVVRELVTNPETRAAIVTESTPSGVKVGEWEIKVNEEAGLKFYDVVGVQTGCVIACDITLYETALSLVKLLNNKVTVNSPRIKEVLELEEKFSHYRQEAAMFKGRAKQRRDAGDFERAAIAEDRFAENKDLALKYRQKLVEISKNV